MPSRKSGSFCGSLFHSGATRPTLLSPFTTSSPGAFRTVSTSSTATVCLRNPAPAGDVMVGYSAHKPLVVGVVRFNEQYIEKYRAAQAARSRRLYDKKLAEQGRNRQPELTAEEKAARRAAARQRATERALAWQKQNREAYNARRAEIRRQKAAGTFIDRRRKSVCTTSL